ncbi:Nucleoid occlusion protein [subsurface metagenome]
MKIKFNQLIPNTYNPRKLFRSASMEELKEATKDFGLIEPLVVRKKGNKYEVVAGMRRYYALKELEAEEVECYVMNLTDEQAVDIAFIENIHREDLTSIEEARVFLTRLKLNPEFLKEFEKSETVSDFFSKNTFGHDHSFIKGNTKKEIKGLAQIYKINPKTIANKLSLLVLPETLQTAIEHKELPVRFGYEIARLRQIKDNDIAQQYMVQMFDEYKTEKFSIDEMNQRITGKIKFEKDKEAEAGKIVEERIQQLKKTIKETNEAIIKEMEKLVELTKTTSKREGLDVDESCQIETIDDVDTKKPNKLLKFLEEESEKYKDDTEYEGIADKINELDSAISDIRLLSNRTITNNLRICPYCHAGIDLKTIKKKENGYQEDLDELKKKREQISGMRGFLVEMSTKIQRQVKSLEKKYKFIKGYETELNNLAKPELENEE